ncbi:MAG: threonine synthase [Kiritimatiellae bacterium]|nr:threonine synthase [Kiritimatiellia bacterium]
MKYISTRGEINPVSFREAVMMGLARDGGLLIPENIPDVSDRLNDWKEMSFIDLAFEVMRLFSDLPEKDLKYLIQRSYTRFDNKDITPVVRVDGIFIMELFHGPTLAFKDVALQFLGNVFEYILKESKQELNILGATSGDTGSAAIQGIRGKDAIRIFIMHPHNKTSKIQEKQMTSVLDDNVFNIAIEGTFDDCQKIMKSLFCDLKFKDSYSLGSINSINWVRVLAQIVYYFYGTFRVMKATEANKVNFAVPTGNFGDIFAGYIALQMGLPIARLVLATNENDILSRFFNSGEYRLGNVVETLSPSMDIQVASNFERYLYYRLGKSPSDVKNMMVSFSRTGTLKIAKGPDGLIDRNIVAGSAGKAETLSTIQQFYDEYGYLLDPHTAVGVNVGLRLKNSDEPMICLATAHPAKFSDAIRQATGRDLAHHPAIDALEGMPTKCDVLPASVSAVRAYMEAKIPST